MQVIFQLEILSFLKCNFPGLSVSSVGWLVCLSQFPKRAGSYTSMLISEPLFKLTADQSPQCELTSTRKGFQGFQSLVCRSRSQNKQKVGVKAGSRVSVFIDLQPPLQAASPPPLDETVCRLSRCFQYKIITFFHSHTPTSNLPLLSPILL